MVRALARKKGSLAKSRKVAKAGTKGRTRRKARSRVKSRKPTLTSRKPLAKSRQKSVKKSKNRAAAARSVKSSASQESIIQTKKRTPFFGVPTPAPEKPPPLLSESKTTSAALALLEKGIKFIYQKDFKKARVEFDSIASAYPRESEIIARVRSYLQICEREEAVRKKPPVAKDQLYTLGVMEHNRGNYDGAIAYFREFLEKKVDVDYIYYSLAASQALKNDIAEALQNLQKAIELNEDNKIYAKNDPDFTPLHAEAQFTVLVGPGPSSPTGSPQV